MMSESSGATRAHRDAIFTEFKESGPPLSMAVFEKALLKAQLAALEQGDAMGQVVLSADRLHFYADVEVWLSRCMFREGPPPMPM